MLAEPLRVLHVVVNMNRGGTETLLMNLYRNIDRKKIQFDFLTFKPGVFDQEIKDLGGRIYHIPYITDVGHFQFTNMLEYFFRLHNDYKIVHVHMDKMSGFILRFAKKANIPIRIAHSHNTESEGNMLVKLYKWYGGTFIHKSATHFYACSETAANWLFKKTIKRTQILKNGIEIDKFQFSEEVRKKVREQLAIDESTFVLGHIGRFTQQKNHLYLLDLYKKVHETIPQSILVLVGDGTLRPQIEAKITELQLSTNVILLGIRPDTNRILQAFDVFVFPSLHEGLPVTLLEAQATGLPCVISDVITREVDLGVDLISYVPLNDTTKWIRELSLLHHEKAKRPFPEKHLTEKGFHIKTTAQKVQQTYQALGERVR